jgi:hypothetical protein
VEGNSRRQEQVEDKISEFKNKIEIKKIEEMLNNSRPTKRMYKSSPTPLKHQT